MGMSFIDYEGYYNNNRESIHEFLYETLHELTDQELFNMFFRQSTIYTDKSIFVVLLILNEMGYRGLL
jgi:hypothetical protein